MGIGSNLSGIITAVIGFVVTMFASTIATALKSCGSIPVIGFLFKFIAIPFSFIASLKWIFMLILGLYFVFVVLLPLIKTIIKAFKRRKARKHGAGIAMQPQMPMAPQMQQPQSMHSTPVRMESWDD